MRLLSMGLQWAGLSVLALGAAGFAASAAAQTAVPKAAQQAAKPAAKSPAKPSTKPAAKPVAKAAAAATTPGGAAAVAASGASAPTLAASTAQAQAPAPVDPAVAAVLTGTIPCELGASVSVQPHPKRAGHFVVASGKQSFDMLPSITSTGTVRLEDKAKGGIWLQLGNKSMLMNEKLGQRVADSCLHPQQAKWIAEAANKPKVDLLGGPIPGAVPNRPVLAGGVVTTGSGLPVGSAAGVPVTTASAPVQTPVPGSAAPSASAPASPASR